MFGRTGSNDAPRQDEEQALDRLLERTKSNNDTNATLSMQRILVDRLIRSLNRNAKSADSLTRALVWLNVLIAFATIVGTIIAVCSFLKAP